MSRKLAAGNWKMNGLKADLEDLANLPSPQSSVDVLICPPAPLIAAATGRGVLIGGQDCHPAEGGAHTGDLSAEMLVDAGASHVILGHSERRADHGETDALVASKTLAAWRAGLTAIVCVGETEAERDAGEALNVIATQISGSVPDGATAQTLVIAYEPVWAIGTGRVPEMSDIAEMHAAMRTQLTEKFGAEGTDMSLLYGGSVKPGNAAEIFAVDDVDGALVGGASLKAKDFGPIVEALAAS